MADELPVASCSEMVVPAVSLVSVNYDFGRQVTPPGQIDMK